MSSWRRQSFSRAFARPSDCAAVRISFAEPVFVEEMASSPEEAGRFVEGLLWPSLAGEFDRLLGHSAA
jgi:hypothetical protein